jgi:predicted regulator of Ras-like GTPase activity (Roadblock/LC7/MglB family)
MTHIFVSYSRKDSEMMQRIVADLKAAGLAVWTDANLTPGTRAWKLEIEKAIESAGALVAILSPDAKASEWVDRELEYARIHDKRIFPLLVRGDIASAVPFELVSSQRLDISASERYQAGITSLIDALRQHLNIPNKSHTDRLRDELTRLSEKLPGIYWIGVCSADGLMVAFESQEIEEDRAAAMMAASLSLSDRVSRELGAGDMHYSFVGGSEGYQFYVAFEEYILGFGVRQLASIDAMFIIIRQWWGPLLELLNVKIPPKI